MTIRTLSKALSRGGFAYSLSGGDLTGGPYWAVDMAKNRERVFNKLPTTAQIKEYVLDNADVLFCDLNAFTGREDRGDYRLSMSKLFAKVGNYIPEYVTDFARDNDQAVVLDLVNTIRRTVTPTTKTNEI